MAIPDDRVTLEWLILADSAQVVGNKLFLAGGGWDLLTVNSPFPVDQIIGIAASFAIPWNETNQAHTAEITILDEDANVTLAQIGHQFEVGRPPGIPGGSTQRTQVAGTMVVRISQPGSYTLRCRIDGAEQSPHAMFRVVARPGAAVQRTDEPR